MHAFKSHGRLSKYRRLQQGSRCEACGTTFHTHARLCRHFRAATQCANTLAASQRWVEAGLVTGNAEADKLDFLTAMIPSIRTEGECIPQRNGWTMTLETRKALAMFSGIEWAAELPPNTDSLIQDLMGLPIHYDEISEVVSAQKHYYDRQGQAMVATERLDAVLQRLYDRAQQINVAWQEQESNLHDGWIRDYRELYWCEEPTRPRPSVRYLYVLHLFSGVKRAGDIHSCVQEISAPPGKILLPVSLDVVLESQRGNLTGCHKSGILDTGRAQRQDLCSGGRSALRNVEYIEMDVVTRPYRPEAGEKYRLPMDYHLGHCDSEAPRAQTGFHRKPVVTFRIGDDDSAGSYRRDGIFGAS